MRSESKDLSSRRRTKVRAQIINQARRVQLQPLRIGMQTSEIQKIKNTIVFKVRVFEWQNVLAITENKIMFSMKISLF